MKGPGSEDGGASIAASAKAAALGRLTGERAFHFGASASAGMIASRTLAIDAPFAPNANLALQADLKDERALAAGSPRAEAIPAKPVADAVPSIADAPAPTPIAPHARAPSTNRASPTRTAAHDGRAERTESTKSAALADPAARPATSAAAAVASGTRRQGGPRSSARSDRLRRAVDRANRSVRRAAPGAVRRGGAVPDPQFLDDGNYRRRDRAAGDRAWPRPFALRLRRSGESTSIFRRAASRTSR